MILRPGAYGAWARIHAFIHQVHMVMWVGARDTLIIKTGIVPAATGLTMLSRRQTWLRSFKKNGQISFPFGPFLSLPSFLHWYYNFSPIPLLLVRRCCVSRTSLLPLCQYAVLDLPVSIPPSEWWLCLAQLTASQENHGSWSIFSPPWAFWLFQTHRI